MAQEIRICSWREDFPDTEGVAVVFDLFRCTSTLHFIADRFADSLMIAPSLESLMGIADHATVFSELSKPLNCKTRFDNSPYLAQTEKYSATDPIFVATTSGTPALFQARGFHKTYAGSLLNFSTLVEHLSRFEGKVTLIPAAHREWEHVEDELVAQAMANALTGFTDQMEFVNACAREAIDKIKASGRVEQLQNKLPTGDQDTSMALHLDLFSFFLSVDFNSGKPANTAKIVKHLSST